MVCTMGYIILSAVIIYLLNHKLNMQSKIEQLEMINEDLYAQCQFWRKLYAESTNS